MHTTKVYIIDHEKGARDSSAALISEMGYEPVPFSSVEDFLDAYDPTGPSCVLTELRMPGLSGVELLGRLTSQGKIVSLVILTAYADTELTVRAMRAGASTVLDKPCRDQDLWEAIREAVQLNASHRRIEADRTAIMQRLERLTVEEKQVLALIMEGKANKAIAVELLLGLRTVEARRQQVFRKMNAGSVAELVRMVYDLEHPALLAVDSATRIPSEPMHSLTPPHFLTLTRAGVVA